MKKIFLGILFILLAISSLAVFASKEENVEAPAAADSLQTAEKVDDWQLDFNVYEDTDSGGKKNVVQSAPATSGGTTYSEIQILESKSLSATRLDSYSDMGFSVGGAKDIDNFRLNIEEGYLPLPSAITYEGLFYDYYFDTRGETAETKDLFSPSYNFAKQRNPLTDEEEIWLSVGLNSNLKESDFSRKKLNLVVVLDISGSMNSPFNEYYYDGNRKVQDEDRRSKLTIATETICSMLDHLKAEDRFGMVLFENRAFLAKPLNPVGETDMDRIKKHILDLRTQGGTNMYAGMQTGTQLFDKYLNVDKSEYENRIIFLTDAMPNRELTDKNSLWGVLDENADKGLYATLIGVGVDFQSQLVEHISKVEGANYYSIHSAKEFKKRLDEEFDYMVTPLVFNLNLVIDAQGYEIKRVCGTPYSAESKGEIMKIGTLFPSPSEEGEVKGGIILVQLQQTSRDGKISLLAGYDDRNGKHFQNRLQVDFKKMMLSSWLSPGLQKGVLLVHYVDLLKEWVEYVRNPESRGNKPAVEDDWQYNKPPQRRERPGLNEWEQTSMRLTVNDHYREEFRKFRKIMQDEMQRFGDEKLQQEVDLLDLLINFDKSRFNYNEPYDEIRHGTTPKGFIYYDDPPRKLNEPVLNYPKFAKDAGIQGTVALELEVLTNGRVGAIDVTKSVLPGPGGLDEAAIEYARQLEFEPAKTNGKPVAVWVTYPVNFSMN
ncbi:MAG: TonB family protein [Candidatus Cloacimonetes bacterium]|nr:TonB family protein [Candidatus Cloacimonadota bacterium]